MRRMSYDKAGRIFRAVNGDWDKYPDVTFADIEDLDVSASTFDQFIADNRETVQFHDEGERFQAVKAAPIGQNEWEKLLLNN